MGSFKYPFQIEDVLRRLCSLESVGMAIRDLGVEATLIVNFENGRPDPFQDALCEGAVPINSPLIPRLLKAICGAGSLVKQGIVVLEVAGDDLRSVRIKCVTIRAIVGAHETGRSKTPRLQCKKRISTVSLA